MKEALKNCLSGNYSIQDSKELIQGCHSMALAYLRIKASRRKLYMLRSECLEDVAWDSIAELFERDDDGRFIRLLSYFNDVSEEINHDSGVNRHLRGLVFTKVEDYIFTSFGAKDPSLKKIIRNLKLAVQNCNSDSNISIEHGNLVLSSDATDLPAMPSDFLQMMLCPKINDSMQIPDILSEIADIFENQKEFRNEISLVAIASVIRKSFVNLTEPDINDSKKPEADYIMLNRDFERFLDISAASVEEETGMKYLKAGKIDERLLEAYIKTAKQVIRDQFALVGENYSQYEYLKRYLEELDYERYRNRDRRILEYFVKKIRNKVIATFKVDWK